MFGGSTQGKKHAVKIDRQNIAIGICVHIGKCAGQLANTGIGKDAVNAAHFFHRIFKSRIDGGFIGNIDIPRMRFHAVSG